MQLVELITQTLVTFLVVIDPIGLTAMFMAITAGHSQAERKHYALKGVAVAAVVLCIFALGGDFLLASLGISLAAFRIAGGVLLFMVAIDMLFVKHTGLSSTTDSEEAEARKKEDVSVFPLAIPLIAGPGAIASVLLLMTEVQGNLQSADNRSCSLVGRFTVHTDIASCFSQGTKNIRRYWHQCYRSSFRYVIGRARSTIHY